MSKILYIYDFDNVLSNGLAREHRAGPEPDRKRELARYHEWLDVVMKDFELDKQVPELMLLLRRTAYDSFTPSFIVTARNEEHRKATEAWLKRYFNPMPRLIMRPRLNEERSADLKEKIIKDLVEKTGATNVCVIDDDQRSEIQEVCKQNNWTFLKAFISAKE